MEKLKMQTADMAYRNVELLGQMFPNCLTEIINADGKLVRAIDFDKLRQELACEVVEGADERYQFTWPDKRAAIRLANAPTNKTLRPCREESVDFDNTENLYIEGDNLEVLKLLRENYLGKVKMIYIDPPYNTGNDFVYNDDFAKSKAEFEAQSGFFDEEGNRMADPMVQNTESNGRFHTDWLNMIYPRLKVAKDLLSDDGVIFISINDKEFNTLKCLCSEIFGESNFLATLIWDKNHSAQAGIFKVYHEYIIVYCKNVDYIKTPKSLNHDLFEAGAMKKVSGRHPASEFTFPAGTRFDAPDGTEIIGEYGDTEKVVITKGKLLAKNNVLAEDVTLKAGFTQANQMKQYFYGDRNSLIDSQGQRIIEFYLNSKGKIKVVKERSVESPQTTCHYGTQGTASLELSNLFGLEESPFSSPKPVKMIRDFILRFVNDGDIVLDFFSGSATTAHAVFEANTSELVKNIKFILVQIAENLDDSLKVAQKDAVRTLEVGIELLDNIGKPHTICEIGKERIRRAGKKIREELIAKRDNIKTELYNITGGAAFDSNPSSMSYFMTKADETKKNKATQLNKELIDLDSKIESFDTGFRVLKLDTSNMKDVYYTPADTPIQQTLGFDELVDNIKWDERTPEDLLFQVLPECNLPLSSKIEEREIHGKKVFVVEDAYLIACFDKDINESVITAIAKEKPYYFVMCDRSIATDNVADNFDQIFNAYSKETIRRIL